MKTVMDAVNELMSVFSGVVDADKDDMYLFYCMRTLRCTSRNERHGNPTRLKFICTKREFNDLVSQLETNFGVCKESYRGYKAQFEYMTNKSTKELDVMDIDWSKAPEGATHWMPESEDWHKSWFTILDGKAKRMQMAGKDQSYDASYNTLEDLIECGLVVKPKPAQPVFTQSMTDNGELPQVGMKVKHLAVDKFVMLPADANSKYVLKSVNDMYSLALLHDIEPIDTRTDKEKAIDAIMESNPAFIRADDLDIRSVLNGAYVKWVGE